MSMMDFELRFDSSIQIYKNLKFIQTVVSVPQY